MVERRRRNEEVEEVPQRRRRHGPDNTPDSSSARVQKINVHGSVRDVDDEPEVPRRRRREVTSDVGIRKRGTRFPEVDLEQFKVANTMSQEMCDGCKHRDIRRLQDNFNILFLTMNEVARELDIDEDEWQERMKKLRNWAKTAQSRKVRDAHKKALDKDIKRAIKRNGGN